MLIKFKHSLSYYLKLYDTRKQNGDLLGALDAVRNAIKFAKTKIDKQSLNMLLGQIYFEMELYKLSCEFYFKGIKVGGARAGCFFGVARNLVFLGKYNLALNYFEKTLDFDAENLFCNAVLEWMQFIKTKLNEKEKISQEEQIILEVKKLVEQENFENAKMLLENLLKHQPLNQQAELLLAKCFFHLNQTEMSIKILKNLLKENPTNTGALLTLAHITLINENLTSFNELSKRFEVCQFNDIEKLFLGKLFAQAKFYDRAIEIFQTLLKTKPYSTKVYLLLSLCHYNKNEKEDALFCLAQARWIDFENPVLLEFFKQMNKNTVLNVFEDLPMFVKLNKLQIINSALEDKNFASIWFKNLSLEDECNWLFETSFFEEGEKLCKVLTKQTQKKIKTFCQNTLVSIRPNLTQKYLLAKEMLKINNAVQLDLTSGFIYKSCLIKYPKFICSTQLFKNSVANAWAYILSHSLSINITQKARELCRIILENNLQNQVDEKTLTCLMFCDDFAEMIKICNYLKVDLANIENAKNLLKIA